MLALNKLTLIFFMLYLVFYSFMPEKLIYKRLHNIGALQKWHQPFNSIKMFFISFSFFKPYSYYFPFFVPEKLISTKGYIHNIGALQKQQIQICLFRHKTLIEKIY